jgi:hypothetical protein
MPTNKTLYTTLYKLCLKIRENPRISNDFFLRDLIYDFKVSLNPGEKTDGQNMPIIVIYIPNIFITDEELEGEDFLENVTKYINYKKTKDCLELLLKFLINFFETNKDCEGSGTVPRFNNTVTDMIFFAQGNGGDKTDSRYKQYFEDGFLYFKSVDDENFKINVPKLFEKKAQPPEPENLQSVNKDVQTPSSVPDSSLTKKEPPEPAPSQSSVIKNDSFDKNTPENTVSFFTLFKNFFSNLFSSFISFITGLFTFN